MEQHLNKVGLYFSCPSKELCPWETIVLGALGPHVTRLRVSFVVWPSLRQWLYRYRGVRNQAQDQGMLNN